MSISRKTIGWTLGIVAALYLGLAYALAPWAWRHYEHQRGLTDRPMFTTTRFGIPGDALNVGLEGDQADVICAMLAAGWHPADPVTLRSSTRIIGDVLARRAYPTAPVSDLLYDGRRQDLALPDAAIIELNTHAVGRIDSALAARIDPDPAGGRVPVGPSPI